MKKILIANRGEIALRIMRTCREMGIATVAVYSQADREAVYVSEADEAYEIGGASALDSYLRIDKLIAVAKNLKCDGLHPGYGFLSEKAELSQACEDAGIVFIGPRPDSILAMGDKIKARKQAQKAGVPVVPGTDEPIQNVDEAMKIAQKFGYPVLVKASAGGGGKGMRVVYEESEFKEAFERAQSEAKKSFQDDQVFIEKYILNPRHVEIQVLCDARGNSLFLYERECSTQRRHQKIIEEAPCDYLKPEVRAQMAKASLDLAKSVNYLGVGTLEYLVDAEQNFYFLEMNTRLQVEHTVTEQILGLDLVRLQIEVAQNQPLTLKQDEIIPRGHAIQCRIYAEDPQNQFMPSAGHISYLHEPQGLGVRIDSGVRSGSEVSIHYDPLLSKVIVWHETRSLALNRLQRILDEYCLLGVTTNLNFLRSIAQSDDFKNQMIHTQYLDHHLNVFLNTTKTDDEPALQMVSALYVLSNTPTLNEQNYSLQDGLWWSSAFEAHAMGRRL